jgi:hypothetical protein
VYWGTRSNAGSACSEVPMGIIAPFAVVGVASWSLLIGSIGGRPAVVAYLVAQSVSCSISHGALYPLFASKPTGPRLP